MEKRAYNFIDITGRKYGRLTVLRFHHSEIVGKRGDKKPYWLCRCDCGNEKIVSGETLKAGHTKSCGCQKSEAAANNLREYNRAGNVNHKHFTTHGDTKKRLYRIWWGMLARCENKNGKQYKDYGGRGIIVCKEWHDYTIFRLWALTNGYKDNLTIDRTNADGNYEPMNCRWVDYKTQNNNRRSNHVLEYNGMKKTMMQWAEYLHMKYNTLHIRIKNGWTVERALTEEVGKCRG
jgi:hypothetical protein